MAGKKGRSGRPRKKPLPQPAAPAISESFGSKNNSVEQTAGDPFGRIEAELKAQHPEASFVPQAGAEGGAGAPALPPAKEEAPEEVVRFIAEGFFKIEAGIGAAIIGLDLTESAILYDQELVEKQIDPLCRVFEKHLPPEFLRQLRENSPEIIFGTWFFNYQLSFFTKIQKLKKELAEEKANKNKPPERQPQPTEIPKKDQFRYPRRDEV